MKKKKKKGKQNKSCEPGNNLTLFWLFFNRFCQTHQRRMNIFFFVSLPRNDDSLFIVCLCINKHHLLVNSSSVLSSFLLQLFYGLTILLWKNTILKNKERGKERRRKRKIYFLHYSSPFSLSSPILYEKNGSSFCFRFEYTTPGMILRKSAGIQVIVQMTNIKKKFVKEAQKRWTKTKKKKLLKKDSF